MPQQRFSLFLMVFIAGFSHELSATLQTAFVEQLLQGPAEQETVSSLQQENEKIKNPLIKGIKAIKNFCARKKGILLSVGALGCVCATLINNRFKKWQKDKIHSLLFPTSASTPTHLLHDPITIQATTNRNQITFKQAKVTPQDGPVCGLLAVINDSRLIHACQDHPNESRHLTMQDKSDMNNKVAAFQQYLNVWQKNECYDAIYKDYKRICRAALQQEDTNFESYEPPTLSEQTEEQKKVISEYCLKNNMLAQYHRFEQLINHPKGKGEDDYKSECKARNWEPHCTWTTRIHLEELIRALKHDNALGLSLPAHIYFEVMDANDLKYIGEYSKTHASYDVPAHDEEARYARIINPLQRHSSNIHCLILMTTNGGHWFALVIDRQDPQNVLYYIADSSGNQERWNDQQIKALITMIESEEFIKAYDKKTTIPSPTFIDWLKSLTQ